MTLAVVREPRRAARPADLSRLRPRRFVDVRRPGRPDARIEQVVVRPSGVHVVVHGSTDVSEVGDRAAIDACLESADAISGLLPARYRRRVMPVLHCHHGEPVAKVVRGVTVVTSATTLEHILRASPVVLSTSEVSEIAARLESTLEAFPVEPSPRRQRWGWRARVLVGLVTTSVVVGASLFAPELAGLVGHW